MFILADLVITRGVVLVTEAGQEYLVKSKAGKQISPKRPPKISLYGLTSAPASQELLKKLGKHSVGVSCLYINKPEDVDLEVIEEMIRISWEVEPGEC